MGTRMTRIKQISTDKFVYICQIRVICVPINVSL